METNVIEFHEDFVELCEHIRSCGLVAFDTEFVSDFNYRPALGLLQFATPERQVAVDPLAVSDLGCWWDIMADDSTVVVVHGGQAEIRFCLHATGRVPEKLHDIQVAEGFLGTSYPLSYSALVQRQLGHKVDNSQTRTDWLRRPLSPEQIRYALEDVEHVLEIYHRQREALDRRSRLVWVDSELEDYCRDIGKDDAVPPWQRIAGHHRLNRREIFTLQRLARWREEEAAFRNRPVRRILRDDLLVDLAKRRPVTTRQALAVRDMNRPEYKRRLDEIVEVIAEAAAVPDAELPKKPRSSGQFGAPAAEDQVLARLLGMTLASHCVAADIAQQLVGTQKDLNELVRSHRGTRRGGRKSQADDSSNEPPKLLRGWRAELCGDLLVDVLEGRIAFRVAPPGSPAPLILDRVDS